MGLLMVAPFCQIEKGFWEDREFGRKGLDRCWSFFLKK